MSTSIFVALQPSELRDAAERSFQERIPFEDAMKIDAVKKECQESTVV